MGNRKLQSLKPTHTVDFFDSFSMRNRTAKCIVEQITLASFVGGDDVARCLVLSPVRKSVIVPLWALVDLATGQRLPYPTDDLVIEEFSLSQEELEVLFEEA